MSPCARETLVRLLLFAAVSVSVFPFVMVTFCCLCATITPVIVGRNSHGRLGANDLKWVTYAALLSITLIVCVRVMCVSLPFFPS